MKQCTFEESNYRACDREITKGAMEKKTPARLPIKPPNMEAQAILKADYLDIVFDDRNKKYGGYELRKNYKLRMEKALLTIMVLSGLVSLAVLWPGKEATQPFVMPESPINLTDLVYEQPELILPPEPVAPVPQDVATADYADPVIVADNETTSEMTTVTELADRQIGTENTEGSATNTDMAGPVVSTMDGSGTATPTSMAEPPKEALRYVEQMPEFEGLRDYLTKNLRYPELAKENNIRGRVVVEFIVDEEGRIGKAVVKKGIGGGCDEEALRVVKNMPKWKAGRQNGKAVKVYLMLPIVFKLQ